jgi:hypothetical protein
MQSISVPRSGKWMNSQKQSGLHGPLDTSKVGSGAYRKTKHPLLTSRIRREPSFLILNAE